MERLLELKIIVEMEFFGRAETIAQVSNVTLGRAVFDAACQMYPGVEIVMRERARIIVQRQRSEGLNAASALPSVP